MILRKSLAKLLQEADQGNAEAANRLFLLVKDQLRAVAKKRKSHVTQGVDLSTTALVDEAFCLVVGQGLTVWDKDTRRKFFAYVATKIHDLLIEAARGQAAQKRGGQYQRAPADVGSLELAQPDDWDNVELLMDLQGALARLESFAPDDARVFRFRYFLNCTFDEVADLLDLSATSAKRCYERTRSWLQRELKEYDHDA